MEHKILVLHGANLNLLGSREPQVYGSITLDEINSRLINLGKTLGIDVQCRQSNIEGELVDALQEAGQWADGVSIKCRWLYPYLGRDPRCHLGHQHPGGGSASLEYPGQGGIPPHLTDCPGLPRQHRRFRLVFLCAGVKSAGRANKRVN